MNRGRVGAVDLHVRAPEAEGSVTAELEVAATSAVAAVATPVAVVLDVVSSNAALMPRPKTLGRSPQLSATKQVYRDPKEARPSGARQKQVCQAPKMSSPSQVHHAAGCGN